MSEAEEKEDEEEEDEFDNTAAAVAAGSEWLFNEELEKSLLPSLVVETPLLAALDAFLSSC